MSVVGESLNEEFMGTRATLLSRLKDVGDHRSWEEFYGLYHRLIRNIARKSGMSAEESQEIVQEVFMDLARKLPEFKYNGKTGSFKKFLKNLVGWRVVDQLRKRKPYDCSPEAQQEIDRMASPDPIQEIWETEWGRNLLDAAMEKTREKVDPRNYQIFDLATTHGMRSTEISKLLRISVARVYVARHRVALKVKLELRALRGRFESELTQFQKESF